MRRVSCLSLRSSGQAFEPELISAMSLAFVNTCETLGPHITVDPATRIVAQKIIELAQRGVHDPDRLRDMVIEEFTRGQ